MLEEAKNSVFVETFGTGKVDNSTMEKVVRENFDFSPKGIIGNLKLLEPRFLKTAAYGHFGRNEEGFTWEVTDKASALKKYLK